MPKIVLHMELFYSLDTFLWILLIRLALFQSKMFFIETLIFVFTIHLSQGFDPFVGFFNQAKPCFETFDLKECNSSILQAFNPPYKGTNTNAATTRFWLFTAKNPDRAVPLHKCGGRLPKNSGFDPKQETIFLAHGDIETLCNVAWPREFKEQFLIRGKYNFIFIDWSWGNALDVSGGIFNAGVAGMQTGFVIKNLIMQNNYQDGKKFYVMGHSAGTFVAARAGRFIREWNEKYKIGRITLLEPPTATDLPGAILMNDSYVDADFVDVYHSDGGDCFPLKIGIIFASGHADFYPNGGVFQLSCYPEIISAFEKGDTLYALASLLIPPLCVHLHIVQFYKASINHPAGFQIGAMCDSYKDFLSGKCKRCCRDDFSKCAVAGFDAAKYFPHKKEKRQVRKYYYELGLFCPYNEDYNFSIYKDCK